MIAIIGVAREEIAYLKSGAEINSEHTYAGMNFSVGTLQGIETVLACSDIGKVPIAITVQIAIDRFDVDMIIVTGPAGPLVPFLQRGDMVIADRLLQFETESQELIINGTEMPSTKSLIAPDKDLITRVTESYHDIFAGKSDRPQLVAGTVVSSDNVISDRRIIGRLQREYGVVACDRDGATVARVCRMNEKPLLLIRTVVDTPDGSFYNQFDAQLQVVPEYITALVSRFIVAPQEATMV